MCSVDLCGALFVAGGTNGRVLFGDSRVPGGLVRVCEAAMRDGDDDQTACAAVRLLGDGRHAICGSRVLSFSPGDGNVALPLRVTSGSSGTSATTGALVSCIDTVDSLAYVGLANGDIQVFDCMAGSTRHLDTLHCNAADPSTTSTTNTGEATLSALAVGANCVYAGFDNGMCVILE